MSGLLPATITKWFSSPSSNTNGSAQTADATDSSTEDEGPESPINNQPPTKRMRFTSPGTYNQFGPSNVSYFCCQPASLSCETSSCGYCPTTVGLFITLLLRNRYITPLSNDNTYTLHHLLLPNDRQNVSTCRRRPMPRVLVVLVTHNSQFSDLYNYIYSMKNTGLF